MTAHRVAPDWTSKARFGEIFFTTKSKVSWLTHEHSECDSLDGTSYEINTGRYVQMRRHR